MRVKKNGKKIVFDNLTLAPIDKSLIDKKNLNFDEINWLNKYHNRVFTSLKKFMNKSEIEDLKNCVKVAKQYNYDEINLNVGCPSKAVQKGSFGACLMQDKKLVRNCLEAMQINYKVLTPAENNEFEIAKLAYETSIKTSSPFVLLIRKGVFTTDINLLEKEKDKRR